MSDAPRYIIAKPIDFLNVPSDRLDICLHEFVAWLGAMQVLRGLLGPDVFTEKGAFVWVDDNLGETRINITEAGELKAAFAIPIKPRQ